MEPAVGPQVLCHRVPIGAQRLGQVAVRQQRGTEFAADACQHRRAQRIGGRQRTGAAIGLCGPCLDSVGGEPIQHVAGLLLAVGIPVGLQASAEQVGLPAASQVRQVGDHFDSPSCQFGQLGLPPVDVKRHARPLHAVEEWPGCLLEPAHLFQARLAQAVAQLVRHPQCLHGVCRGIGDLAVAEGRVGGIGQLRGGLAFDAQSQIALGCPCQPVEEAEPGQALVEQSISQLRVPPSQRPDCRASRGGWFHEMRVDDPIVEGRVPGVRCQIWHPKTLVQCRGQLRPFVSSDIDHPGALCAIGSTGRRRDHA